MLTCFSIYLFAYSEYFWIRKLTFLYYPLSLVSKSLPCCIKSSAHFPDFYLFSPPSLRGVAPKITMNASLLSSLVYFLHRCLWFKRLFSLSFVYLKKEQPIFAGCLSPPPLRHGLLRERLQIMTPKPIVWIPRWIMFWFLFLFMGSKLKFSSYDWSSVKVGHLPMLI